MTHNINWKRSFARLLLSTLVTLASYGLALGQEQQTNPAQHWLNGKWRGEDPGGDFLEMTLQVVEDSKVTGSGAVPGLGLGRRVISRPADITGTVQGNDVRLEIFNPKSRGTRRWRLRLEDGALRGKTAQGFNLNFTRVE